MSELKKYTHANGRDSTMTETSLPLEFLNKNDIWYKASDVDAQLQPVRWTTTKPDKPGWYWYNSGLEEGPEVVRVRPSRNIGEGLIAVNDLEYDLVEHMDGQWAGPLAPPLEPMA